jgi:hypothetical protein
LRNASSSDRRQLQVDPFSAFHKLLLEPVARHIQAVDKWPAPKRLDDEKPNAVDMSPDKKLAVEAAHEKAQRHRQLRHGI